MAAVLPAILVGLACGVLGTIFTVLNVKVVRLRDEIIQVRPACSVLSQHQDALSFVSHCSLMIDRGAVASIQHDNAGATSEGTAFCGR